MGERDWCVCSFGHNFESVLSPQGPPQPTHFGVFKVTVTVKCETAVTLVWRKDLLISVMDISVMSFNTCNIYNLNCVFILSCFLKHFLLLSIVNASALHLYTTKSKGEELLFVCFPFLSGMEIQHQDTSTPMLNVECNAECKGTNVFNLSRLKVNVMCGCWKSGEGKVF